MCNTVQSSGLQEALHLRSDSDLTDVHRMQTQFQLQFKTMWEGHLPMKGDRRVHMCSVTRPKCVPWCNSQSAEQGILSDIMVFVF